MSGHCNHTMFYTLNRYQFLSVTFTNGQEAWINKVEMCLDYDKTIIGTEGSSLWAALIMEQVVIMSEEDLCGWYIVDVWCMLTFGSILLKYFFS